jgi:hypothetical protein
MSKHSQDSEFLEEKLIRAGGLRLDDLAFNQAGELSPGQRRWLMLEVAAWIFQAGIGVILMPCIWVFFYFLHDDLRIFLLGCLLWNVALGISVFICIHQHAQPIWTDIKNGEIASIAGTVVKHYSVSTGRAAITYVGIEIRGHMFSVTASVHASVVEHQTYRLFYIPNTKRLMNIEPLPLSDAKKQSVLAALQEHASSLVR